jgi:hypothetical protein
MALAAPGAEIHQPLDVHRHLAAQIALDVNLPTCSRSLSISVSDRSLTLVAVLMPAAARRSRARGCARCRRSRSARSRHADDSDVYATNPGHVSPQMKNLKF